MATKTSRIPRKAKRFFWGEIFCLEYPSTRSEKGNVHFANYRFSFRKLQILISQTTDFHFANYRFPFRFVPFRFVPFRFVPFRFANYSKPPLSPNSPPLLGLQSRCCNSPGPAVCVITLCLATRISGSSSSTNAI